MTNFPRLLWFLGNSLHRLNWKQSKLLKYQEKKLRNIVKYAQDFVPFYNNLFKMNGVSASDIRTLDDLSKLPVINKARLRKEKINQLISSEYSLNNLKPVSSSGSTGNPFNVYINKIEDDWRKAIYMRANISCGQKPRDCWAVITGPRHFHDTTKLQRLFGIFAQELISIYDDVPKQIMRLRAIKPDVLDGYSQSMLLVAKKMQELDINDINPRIMFGSAELINKEERKILEAVFNAPFYDQFGCSEIDRSAWQCPERNGYHLDVDSVITQFVDENGYEVAPGERGNIVYTSLFNHSMPLIRYSVGDVGQAMDDECSCGRVLPLMKVVEGRNDSFVKLPDNKIISPLRLYWIMNEFVGYSGIEQYRIIQKKKDLIRLLIKASKGADQQTLAKKLVDNFRKNLSLDPDELEVDVMFVDELPKIKGGKLASVVSEVNLNQNSTN